MKRLIAIFSLVAISSTFFTSCEKSTLGLSKVTVFPTISLVGEKYISIHVDDAYTDEGAEAFIGTDVTEYTVVGEVDPTTTGLYRIDYTAFNSDGFSASVQRYVLVSDVSDDVDISGSYKRTSNSSPVKIVKIKRGMFINDNLAGSTRIKALMVMLDETTMEVPSQVAGASGEVDAYDELFTFGAKNTYELGVLASGFGDQIRYFEEL